MNQAAREGASSDNAVAKAVTILTALRTHGESSNARELAVLTGIPRSTVQRILTTLTASGMLTQNPEDHSYELGPHAMWIGLGFRRNANLVTIARPLMVSLRNATGETVGLSVAVGTSRVFIEEVQSRSELRFASELGRYFPLWSGATGRVLSSGLSDAEIDEILSDDTHRDEVDHALPVDDNRAAIAKVREDGYATAFSESIASWSSIAVPVLDSEQAVIAALSLSGPTERLTRERMAEFLPLLRDAAATITLRLGGTPRPPDDPTSDGPRI